jgi:uncharacterized peroxidase-related enzyme
MAHIRTIDPTEADDRLAPLYRQLIAAFGQIPNLYRLQSTDPSALEAHLRSHLALLQENLGLPHFERVAIALAVSISNNCHYSARRYARALREHGGTESLILALELGENPAVASDRLRELIYYARKLTLLPNAASRDDMRQLRRVGLTDLELLQVVQVTAFINFENRLAQALGATPDPAPK